MIGKDKRLKNGNDKLLVVNKKRISRKGAKVAK